jgi:hypothetical protein
LLFADAWIQVDFHASLEALDITNPETWNRYAYVMNEPNGKYDLLGLSCSILLNNSLSLLSAPQLSALQSTLQSILGQAGADVSVDTAASTADITFNLTVTQNPTAYSNMNTAATVGYTVPLEGGGISNRGFVFAEVSYLQMF